ncbi:TetR/AcrR family transcriptional regulator [Brevundimonas sp.]|uniref:TetR/AcrR family transcriptional regulator n=1 Tax=Brevundimonas sp. TaxID=1871086 RepID=UPI00260EEFF6|nr:TetR/AcrR family transcriptional regulator [Brevundimonas sp.]
MTAPSRRSKGERTRAHIDQCVIELVNEMPVADVKISTICTRAGIAVGAFYFHFASREEALESAAAVGLTQVYTALLEAPAHEDLMQELVAFLGVFDQFRTDHPDRVAAIYRIVAAHRPVRATWLNLRGCVIDRLTARFARARAGVEGGFASDYVLAQFLLGAVERFTDDVFVGSPDDRLPVEAGDPDVYLRQQALTWHRAILGRDP